MIGRKWTVDFIAENSVWNVAHCINPDQFGRGFLFDDKNQPHCHKRLYNTLDGETSWTPCKGFRIRAVSLSADKLLYCRISMPTCLDNDPACKRSFKCGTLFRLPLVPLLVMEITPFGEMYRYQWAWTSCGLYYHRPIVPGSDFHYFQCYHYQD